MNTKQDIFNRFPCLEPLLNGAHADVQEFRQDTSEAGSSITASIIKHYAEEPRHRLCLVLNEKGDKLEEWDIEIVDRRVFPSITWYRHGKPKYLVFADKTFKNRVDIHELI